MSNFNIGQSGASSFDPLGGSVSVNRKYPAIAMPTIQQINQSLHCPQQINIATEESLRRANLLIQTWFNSILTSSNQLEFSEESQKKVFESVSVLLAINEPFTSANFNKLFLEDIPKELAKLGVLYTGRSVRYPGNDKRNFLFVPFNRQFHEVVSLETVEIKTLEGFPQNNTVIRNKVFQVNQLPYIDDVVPSCILHGKIFLNKEDLEFESNNRNQTHNTYISKGFHLLPQGDVEVLMKHQSFEGLAKILGDRKATLYFLTFKLLNKVHNCPLVEDERILNHHEGEHLTDQNNTNLNLILQQKANNNDDAEIYLEVRGRLNEFQANSSLALISIIASVQKFQQLNLDLNTPSMIRNRVTADLLIFNALLESVAKEKEKHGIKVVQSHTFTPEAQICVQLDKVNFRDSFIKELAASLGVIPKGVVEDPRVFPGRHYLKFI